MTKVGVIVMDGTRVIGDIDVGESEAIELGGITRDMVTMRPGKARRGA
jgi:hypothetical protein